MQNKAGAQISRRAFTQSLVILFILMMVAGILTILIPAGSFERVEADGTQTIVPDSFQYTEDPDYPAWRWFIAPLEVLTGPNGLTIITITIFILIVGVAFAIMDRSNILKSAIGRLVKTFGNRKYIFLMLIALFFMGIGAFFGIFEEVVPLVPLMLALSYSLGWDALVGLGMSILATNMGFSAAITNPFTLGVAQELTGLPIFSGAWFRVIIFIVVYGVFMFFLVRYAKRVEDNPSLSPVYREDQQERVKYLGKEVNGLQAEPPGYMRAMTWLTVFIILILTLVLVGPFIPAISGFTLPIVGLLFFIAGLGAGLLSGIGMGAVGKAAWQGFLGILPAVPLILMASSINYIVTSGGVRDTILHSMADQFQNISPFAAVLLIYLTALLIEFFVASGSAKAFLVMPLIIPLADLSGVTHQTSVTAYVFGDGFSNMIYPTNPVLLICLGLTVVSYGKWIRWTIPLWLGILLVTIAFLGIAVLIGYGPF